MKNRLNKLWNTFPRNKTQTRYFRFLKSPNSEIKTAFTDSVSTFTQRNKKIVTKYSKYLGDLDD